METLTEAISRLVPELEEERLLSLTKHLGEEGYRTPSDLVYLESDDLKPFLKNFHLRKLLHAVREQYANQQLSSANKPASLETHICTMQGTTPANSSPALPTSAVSPSNLQAHSSTSSAQWISNFEINWSDMPHELQKACENGDIPKPHLRRKMISVIGAAIAAHDGRPRLADLKLLSRRIVQKYVPSLSDTTSTGCIIGDGSASFTRQLQVQMDNRRRPHRSPKKRQVNSEACIDEPSNKRPKLADSYGCVEWQPGPVPFTWNELEEKKKALQASAVSNETLMKETFPLQRKDINSASKTIVQIHEEWPHLFLERSIFIHLKRLMGFNYLEIFVSELASKGRRIHEYMIRAWKAPTQPLLQRLQALVDSAGNPVPFHIFILELLTSYFKEDYETLVSFHPVGTLYCLSFLSICHIFRTVSNGFLYGITVCWNHICI